MALEDPVIIEDFKKVLAQKDVSAYWDFDIIFKADDTNMGVLKMDLLRFFRNYAENYKDSVLVSVSISRYDYVNFFYPNRELLKATLTRTRKADDTSNVETGEKLITEFDVELLDLVNVDALAVDKTDIERTRDEIVEINFELTSTVANVARWITVGGSFRNNKLSEICKTMMAKYVPNTKGVSMVTPANDMVYPVYLLPNNVSVVDLPGYFQVTDGLYASGCGSYLQNDLWYIFPLWDYKRFDRTKKTLTVINLPTTDAPMLDKSYYVEEGNLFILSTGDTSTVDDSLEIRESLGDGIKYFRSSALHDKMVEVSGNKVTLKRDKTFKQLSIKDRGDGHVRTLFAKKMITDNPYVETSKIAKGHGHLLSFNWNRADQALIYPGMQTKFIYMKNGMPYSLQGTVVGLESTTATQTNSVTDKTYLTNCMITIFAENDNDY